MGEVVWWVLGIAAVACVAVPVMAYLAMKAAAVGWFRGKFLAQRMNGNEPKGDDDGREQT